MLSLVTLFGCSWSFSYFVSHRSPKNTLKLWFLSQEKQRFLWERVWFFRCSWSFFYLDGAFFVFLPHFLHFLPFRFVGANLNCCLIFYSVFFVLRFLPFLLCMLIVMSLYPLIYWSVVVTLFSFGLKITSFIVC